jgi:hypothetical protein
LDQCEIKFLDIENIHGVRESLVRLKEQCVLASLAEKRKRVDHKMPSSMWLTSLASTGWLEHLRLILRGSYKIVKTITSNDTSVLVHCSDGYVLYHSKVEVGTTDTM